ncbi:MAG TPA: glycosyltransferase family 39 protein [Acidobacteriaceae bacterium]|nr:glycosyltransferase family 39 protein [Acidobacteriaceae bacterium]
MNSTDELQTDPRETRGRSARSLRGTIAGGLEAAASLVEAHPWTGLLLILAFYLVYLQQHVRLRPPWHDELFTFYIAQAPTFGEMLRWTQTVDLNPPLSYVITRLVFRVMHPGMLSLRLPSMVAFFLAALCLYAFVARRLSRVYGMAGALVLLGSVYKAYSFEARPYALVLAFLGLAAVSWQRAIEEHRRARWPWLLLLVLGGFGMLLSHVLALVAYGGLFFAEIARFARRRRPDWPLWICLVLPLSSGLLYFPLFQNHGSGAFPSAFQSSLLRVAESYGAVWVELASLLAAAMIAIILLKLQNLKLQNLELQNAPAAGGSRFTAAEATFAVYLLLVPLIIALEFMRSHAAYFDRYGMAAIFGAGLVVPWLIASWTGTNRAAGLLTACILALGIIPPMTVATRLQNWIEPPPPDSFDLSGNFPAPFSQIKPDLPFVDASGLTFLEMNSRESAEFLSRVYYLTDLQSAVQYSHATIFEGFGGLKHVFPIRANVTPYPEFVERHSKFLVYGTYDYPEDWLLRKLLADGADVRLLGSFPHGYKDRMLYEVTMPRP